MALGNDGIRSDATELRIRFICGAIAGVISGAAFAVESQASALRFVVWVGICGSVTGLLARQYGDRFWLWVRRWCAWGPRP
jgi:hypothetical protein